MLERFWSRDGSSVEGEVGIGTGIVATQKATRPDLVVISERQIPPVEESAQIGPQKQAIVDAMEPTLRWRADVRDFESGAESGLRSWRNAAHRRL